MAHSTVPNGGLRHAKFGEDTLPRARGPNTPSAVIAAAETPLYEGSQGGSRRMSSKEVRARAKKSRNRSSRRRGIGLFM